uniref:ZP domain-containing protein n=1 Tax=Toxocara canis TaxID=6265 RepID=A0A183URC9_TOXCA
LPNQGGPGLAVPPYFTPGGPGPVLPNQANVVSCYVTSLSAIPEWHGQLRCNVAQCHSGMAWSVAV